LRGGGALARDVEFEAAKDRVGSLTTSEVGVDDGGGEGDDSVCTEIVGGEESSEIEVGEDFSVRLARYSNNSETKIVSPSEEAKR
jgi:hypothetical protein